MCVVFDFDGVLADTHDLVLRAYREVGVEPPDEAWGSPWQEWLADPEAHARKTARYVELIKEGALDDRVLSATYTMLALHSEHEETLVLTGASLEAVMAFGQRYCGVYAPVVLGTSCGDVRKSFMLMQLREDCPVVVYVDDDEVRGRRIVEWTHDESIHFIHYCGQGAKLYEEIRQWMPSS